jgi:hypothetical protein
MGTVIDLDFRLIDDIEQFKREEATPVSLEAIIKLKEEVEETYKPLDKQKQDFAKYIADKDIMQEVFKVEEVNDKRVEKANSLIGRILKALNI